MSIARFLLAMAVSFACLLQDDLAAAYCFQPPTCSNYEAFNWFHEDGRVECFYERCATNANWTCNSFALGATDFNAAELKTEVENAFYEWESKESDLPNIIFGLGETASLMVRMFDHDNWIPRHGDNNIIGVVVQAYSPDGSRIIGGVIDIQSSALLQWGTTTSAGIYARHGIMHELGHMWRLKDVTSPSCASTTLMYELYDPSIDFSSVPNNDAVVE